jgi:hypothetical protein
MKVLHVIPSVGPLRGGPSVIIQAQTRGLARKHFSLEVVTDKVLNTYASVMGLF